MPQLRTDVMMDNFTNCLWHQTSIQRTDWPA